MMRFAALALSGLLPAVAWPAAAPGELGGLPAMVRFLPEPSTLLLIGIALLCVVIVARHAQKRRRRKD